MNTNDDMILKSFDRERYTIYAIADTYFIPYDDVEDILLETYTRFMEHYPEIRDPEKIHLLIIRIVKNLCNDYHRQKNRRPVDYLDSETAEPAILSDNRKWEYEPEDASMGHLLEQDLMDALRHLRPIYYEIFLLMVIEGRSVEEVSRMLNITVQNCRERLHRANNMLADYLEEHSDVWITRKREKKKPPFGQPPDSRKL